MTEKKKNFNSRTKRISIRFEHQVLKAMDEAYKTLKVDRSTFIREKLADGQITVRTVDKSFEKILFELNKIGVNINQMAHRFNALKEEGSPSEDLLRGIVNICFRRSKAS